MGMIGSNPFRDGYNHGLHGGEGANPEWLFTPSWFAWELGNELGGHVYRATIEAIYIAEGSY